MNAYATHIERICREHGFPYTFVNDPMKSFVRIAETPPKVRFIAFPCLDTMDARGYAAALHELGHAFDALTPDGEACFRALCNSLFPSPALTYQLEGRAWAWARANAIEWTDAMEELKVAALLTYTKEFLSC